MTWVSSLSFFLSFSVPLRKRCEAAKGFDSVDRRVRALLHFFLLSRNCLFFFESSLFLYLFLFLLLRVFFYTEVFFTTESNRCDKSCPIFCWNFYDIDVFVARQICRRMSMRNVLFSFYLFSLFLCVLLFRFLFLSNRIREKSGKEAIPPPKIKKRNTKNEKKRHGRHSNWLQCN